MLPSGISIEIVDYEENNGTRFERQEINGTRIGERSLSTSTNEEDSDSTSGSLTSSSESDDEEFEVIPEENQNQEFGEAAAEYETWTCYHHFKKFRITFVLDENILRTVRKILTEENSAERYDCFE